CTRWGAACELGEPYTIGRADGAPLLLAGLWDGWRDPATDTVRRSFTIVTSAPNETMATIHHRMPVMPHEEDSGARLDRESPDRGRLLAMLEPRDGPELAIRAVSQLVN